MIEIATGTEFGRNLQQLMKLARLALRGGTKFRMRQCDRAETLWAVNVQLGLYMARSGGGQTPFPGLISSPNTTVATNVKISVNAKCRLDRGDGLLT